MFREKIIGQMFAALSATNEAILRTPSPDDLYRSVCEAAVHGGGFVAAAILLESGRELHPAAGAGEAYGADWPGRPSARERQSWPTTSSPIPA